MTLRDRGNLFVKALSRGLVLAAVLGKARLPSNPYVFGGTQKGEKDSGAECGGQNQNLARAKDKENVRYLVY